jgi:hypothetical protein
MNKVSVGAACIAAVAMLTGAVLYWKYDAWVAIPSARKTVLRFLKDPESAQFRNERLTSAGALCGELNAKNSMGGYVGFKRYISTGPDSNYLEGDGSLGPISTSDIIAKLDHKTAVLRMHIKWRGEGIEVPRYTDKQLDDLAASALFKEKWDASCEGDTI